jgi:hypothetical protein
MGSVWGLRGQFWVFQGPRPSGNPNNIIWSKNAFSKKTCFFGHLGPDDPVLEGGGGSKGVQIQFFFVFFSAQNPIGPMNSVFLWWKKLAKNFEPQAGPWPAGRPAGPLAAGTSQRGSSSFRWGLWSI